MLYCHLIKTSLHEQNVKSHSPGSEGPQDPACPDFPAGPPAHPRTSPGCRPPCVPSAAASPSIPQPPPQSPGALPFRPKAASSPSQQAPALPAAHRSGFHQDVNSGRAGLGSHCSRSPRSSQGYGPCRVTGPPSPPNCPRAPAAKAPPPPVGYHHPSPGTDRRLHPTLLPSPGSRVPGCHFSYRLPAAGFSLLLLPLQAVA